MINFKKLLFQFFVFSLLMPFASHAQCALYPIGFDEQIANSNLIIEGKVINQYAYKNDIINKIFTCNTIRVYAVFKGNCDTLIHIITAGGKLQNEAEFASSLLSLRAEQNGMFFLNEIVKNHTLPNSKQVYYDVYSSSQGFYEYQTNTMKIANAFEVYSNENDAFYKLLTTQYNLTVKQRTYNFEWSNNIEVLRLTVINNFSPLQVTAGTNTDITINGFGFGTSRGTSKVWFKNSDNGGNTDYAAEPSQYKSWTDTKIVVSVPHKAGTGKISIDLGSSGATSSASLQVTYAIINTGGESIYAAKQIAKNKNKGYIWTYSNSFYADSIARENFLVSFKKWRCTSFINWSISSNKTTINKSERDSISVISFDDTSELPAGVLGLCYSYYSGCTEKEWYIEEQDMLFKVSEKWHFGDGTIPSNKLDFQSVALHELGHGHQLAHVINPQDLMHFSISNGVQKRNIDAPNLEGAQWLINKSTSQGTCSFKPMQLLDSDLCQDENFGYYTIQTYPNPFENSLNINLYLTLESKLQFELYDINGKLIKEFISEKAPKGVNEFILNANVLQLSAGLYVLKMIINDEKTVRKIVKL